MFGVIEERAERSQNFANDPDERGKRSILTLYGQISDAESLGIDVLSHEDSADFLFSCLHQRVNQA